MEIIGILPHRFYSEVFWDPVSEFDVDFIRDCAQAHEAAGFDRVLIANSAIYPDSLPLATWVTSITSRLKVMIAHRPGFVVPTMAARMLATIERTSPGRVGVHIITGSNDVEMRADGDYLTKEERYSRSREYVEVMKRMWAEEEPFDHEGKYYRFEGAYAAVKPTHRRSIPVFWSGSSPAGIENGSAVADVYALAGGAPDQIASTIRAIRDAAGERRKEMEFLLSSRIILADTETAAWNTANDHLRALVTELAERGDLEREHGESLEEAIDRKTTVVSTDSRNGCVFRAFAKVGIGRPIANCLVGTPDQIVKTLSDFARTGVSRFILAGYDPRTYPALFGKILLPQIREIIEPIVEKM